MNKTYSAIYYPDCYIENEKALSTYLLIYDDLHFIALSDEAKNPTEYLSKIPKYTTVKSITKGQDIDFIVSSNQIRTSTDPGKIDMQTRRVLFFYQFVQRYKELIGNTIFFHPHLFASASNRVISKLFGEGLPREELANFIFRNDEEMGAIEHFIKKNSSIRDDALWRIVPTATKIAKEKDLILVSDKNDIPVPVISNEIKSVRNLTRQAVTELHFSKLRVNKISRLQLQKWRISTFCNSLSNPG